MSTLAESRIETSLATRQPELDLARCGLTSLAKLSELFTCTHLHALYLSDTRTFDGEQWVEIQRTPGKGKQNKINVLPAKLGLLTQLRVLVSEGHYFSNSDVKDLGCVRTMTALTHLDLWGNRVSELGPLAALAELRTLNLNKNAVVDLGALRGATKLESLALDNNQIESIDAVSALTNLRELHLRGNRVRDLAVLERLPKLEVLAIEANPVEDLRVLAKLPSLRFLNVGLHLIDEKQRALVAGLSIARVV